MREEDYLFALSLLPHIGYKRLRILFLYFGTPKEIWKSVKHGDIPLNLSEKALREIREAIKCIDIEKEIEKLHRKNVKIITFTSPEYPFLLRKTSSPPIVLYVRGELPEGNYISVVGTRRPSSYGITMTERLSRGLALRGAVVVSGMARGIDTHAHISTLESGGKTVAVLGTGVDVVYPPENKRLYERIIENGAVISEYPLGIGPKREHFPKRNRIIAGISLGTVVVEAPERSGALITAGFAVEEGREVFAVPGRADSGKFKGTNKLIKEGAKLIENVDDIIEEFPYIDWVAVMDEEKNDAFHMLSESEKMVYNLIGDMPKYIDEINTEGKLSHEEVCSALLNLELKGLIREIGGKRYCRIK